VWWKVQNSDGSIAGWIPEGDRAQPYVVPQESGGSTTKATPTTQPTGTASASPSVNFPGLKPGVYRLTFEAPEIGGNNRDLSHIMLVATSNITLKIAQGEVMAWVTDLKGGQPVPNVAVQFYHGTKATFLGTPVQTDQDGIARLALPVTPTTTNALYDDIYAVVSDDTHFGIGSSNWTDGIDARDFDQPTDFTSQDTSLYLYTDRKLYRPGEKVYFRGILRQRSDEVYSLSSKKVVPVEIFNQLNQSIYQKDLPLDSFGTFADNFTIDSASQLGSYQIVARPKKSSPKAGPTPTPTPNYLYQQGNDADPQFTADFTVAEFRVPEFAVELNAEKPQVIQNDNIRVTVDSSYFFGGQVTNAHVDWAVRVDPYSFNYQGAGNYSFADYDFDQPYGNDDSLSPLSRDRGDGTTDSLGKFTITIPAKLGSSRHSAIYMIEATVSDESDQQVSGRTQVIVNQGAFNIGVGTDYYVGAAKHPQTVNLIAVDHDSKAQSGTALEVKVVQREWTSVQTVEPGTGRTIWQNDIVEKDVTRGKVQTNAEGKATFTVTPPRGGVYKIYGTGRDAQGNTISASTFVWIAGEDYVPWRQPNSNRIDLVADRKSYKVGDTASILIPTPFQTGAIALITVERGSILKHEVVTLPSNSTLFKLPITADMAPNTFISVMVIKGEDKDNFTATFRSGLIQLAVDADHLGLNVAISSDKAQAGPREQVTYKLHVTNYAGEPVEAQVGLALIDKAILSLQSDDTPSLLDYFYAKHGLAVRTATTLVNDVDQKTQEIINARKGGGGGGGGGGLFTVRQNFVSTPLWNPSVVTDKDGNAAVTVNLPDQLTSWQLDARAVTLPMGETNSTLVGQNTHTLISTKPILIRPETPRFFVVGDTSTLAAVVNNNTGAEQTITVSAEIDGAAVKGELVRQVKIQAGGHLRFEWPITVLDTAAINATFKVITADGKYTDAAKSAVGQGDDKTLPVLTYQTPDTVSTSGVIGKEGGIRTEGLLLPPKAGGSLNVHIDRSLASSATAALHVLKIYPYYCIEQTVSRFLPDVMTYHAETALSLKDEALKADLSATIETALQRIYHDQHSDGGWGWFVQDNSDLLVSSYTVLGLSAAAQEGWQVDRDVLKKATDNLRDSLINAEDNTPAWQLNRQAFMLYVLARAKAGDVSRSVKLFDQRDRMNLDALAFLAMDFAIVEPDSGYHRQPLIDSIKKAALYGNTGRHWEEKTPDWVNWSTNVRTTAIVLDALVKTQPSDPYIPDTVRWLMSARKNAAWETTQETAWSVMALTDWMQQTNDLKPAYHFDISVNGQAMTSGENASADNARQSYDLSVSVKQLLAAQVNQMAVSRSGGDGTLYYTAELATYLPVEDVKAISRGITVQRSYSLQNDKDHTPITSAHVGDLIRVTLTIVAPDTLNYLAIEDPIPAGMEAVDPHLENTRQVGVMPNIDPRDPLSYGWGYWWFGNVELRDDRTVLYATYLPKGTYQFSYTLHAGVAGQYHVLPVNGHEFYMPEVFGRSDGQMFSILPVKGTP
jgi:uncharacterized protein YfaS (alpha-2-macroglobulin family)